MGWLDDLTFSTVIVHTKDGQSLKGLKAAVHDDALVLRDVMLLQDSGPVMLNGVVPIPRENLSFMQVLDGDQ
jgi:hypothetical protein